MKHPTNAHAETRQHQPQRSHAMTLPQQDELRPIDDDPQDPGPKPPPRPPRPGGGGSTPGEPKLGTAIKKKWQALGGESWGRLDEEVGETSVGGRGRLAQFIAKDGSLRQIVWTSTTGAREVSPPISGCWARVGHANGVLGFPTTDCLVAHDGIGRYQLFERGTIVWHPQTGAFETHGDINAKYAERQGSRFGYPTTDETATSDGRGRFNHFFDPATGSSKSIYWTAQTRAFSVEGLIRGHYAALGWERGLGYPTSDEQKAHDGVGRFHTFERGIIVWHPQTGACAVIGDILARYLAVGGTRYGYPTTDESATPDGRGRFNHFVDVNDGHEKSIYWTPETGAHEVFGLIRRRWASLGWEKSHLGYPTSGEQAWPEGQANSLQQAFQGGRILMRGSDAVTVEDPVAFEKGLRGGGGFGGRVHMHLHSDGRVRFFGEVTNGSYQDYDYSIYTLVRSPNLNLAMRKSGQINMQVFGRNKNRWSEDATHSLVNASFADLSTATFEVHDNHEGGITGKIDDVLSTLAAWTVTGALGPAVVGVIYAGIELGALVTGGSFEAGPRIIAGTLWMLGPEGYLVGMAVDALARIGTRSRGLHNDEKQFLRLVFSDSINLDRITLTDTAGKSKRPFTFPSPRPDTDMTLNLGDGYEPIPKLRDEAYVALLVHEATHAWQYKHMANHSSYILRGIFDSEYNPGTLGKPWHTYNIEQQATIVEKWAAQYYKPGVAPNDVTNSYGLLSSAALNDPSFRYIAGHIRVGRNR